MREMCPLISPALILRGSICVATTLSAHLTMSPRNLQRRTGGKSDYKEERKRPQATTMAPLAASTSSWSNLSSIGRPGRGTPSLIAETPVGILGIENSTRVWRHRGKTNDNSRIQYSIFNIHTLADAFAGRRSLYIPSFHALNSYL